MSVATFVQTNYTTQDASTYKNSIDSDISVTSRIGALFACHQQSSPNMTVRVDAGAVVNGITLTEVAAQSTGTITAPASNSRIDRVVADSLTGVVSVITGVSGSSPAIPSLTAGKIPLARVLLTSSSTTITNSMIADERCFLKPNLQSINEFTSSPSISSGVLTLDLNLGSVFNVSLNASITTLTISNPPASGTARGFTLKLTADGTARTIAWGSSVLWAGGTAPTLTSTSGKVDVFTFFTLDGGTTYYAFVGGQSF